MSVLQTAQSLTVDALLTLELGELEALLQRGNAALVAKAKQTVQDCKNEVSTMEQKRQKLLEFEPKLLECFASSPVKLNVGGTYFSTSVGNLTREPNTFFSAMFSGRWDVKTNPKDDAVFVDRSPLVFEFIIDYMRTGEIDLDGLSPQQFNALLKEADFYQIASLLKMFSGGEFDPKVKGDVQLSKGNSCATCVGNGPSWSYATSLVAFSPSVREMTIKLIEGENVMIGVAPKSILEADNDSTNCGWHVFAYDGSLYGQDGSMNKQFKHKIGRGDVVTVKLDEEFNISFEVDGEDWDVAYPSVAEDYSVPLYLSVAFGSPCAAVELL